MNLRWLLLVSVLLFSISSFAQESYEVSDQAKKYKGFNFDVFEMFANGISQNDTLIPVKKGKWYQYLNTYTKKETNDLLFEEAYPFRSKHAIVKANGKYGVINRNFQYVVQPTHADAYAFILSQYIPQPQNEESNIGPKQFDFGSGTFDFIPICSEPASTGYYFDKRGSKFQMMLSDAHGRYIANSEIVDTVYSLNYYGALVGRSKKIGMLDKKGKTVIPFSYDDIKIKESFSTIDGPYFFALKKGKNWHYFHMGKPLFQNTTKPDMVYSALFMFKVGKLYNYFDMKGKALPRNYKWIDDSGNMAVDAKGRVVLFNNKKEEFIYYTP